MKNRVQHPDDRNVELETAPNKGGSTHVYHHSEVEIIEEGEEYSKVQVTDNEGVEREGYILNDYLAVIEDLETEDTDIEKNY